MALKQELIATQLLQGLQKKDPRLYDLVTIIIDNVKDIHNIVEPVRTLSKSTIGRTRVLDSDDLFYEIEKRVSLRI